MPTVTPLNNWPVPVSTDLVKDGASAIESLGDAIDASVGSGLLVWQTWAPTLSDGWANGNGTWDAKYVKLGKIVIVEAKFTVGSTTTKGTSMVVSLPVTARAANRQPFQPLGFISQLYPLLGTITTTTTANIYASSAAGSFTVGATMSATTPATWVTGSSLHLSFTYEAA